MNHRTLGCRKKGVKTGEIQERRVQDRRDTEWERCWTGGIKDSWEAGQVECRNGGNQDCRESGLEELGTGGIQDWRDLGLKGCRKGGFRKGGMQERRNV